MYIELCLQWDPHLFLFRSPARYDISVYIYSSIDLLQIPCQDLARFHTWTSQPAVALIVGKDPLRKLTLLSDMHTIGCFGLPSDSSTSAYTPSENPPSPFNSDYHSAHMPRSKMSEGCPIPRDRLSTLESTVDSMMSQSEATKSLLLQSLTAIALKAKRS